MPLTKIEPIYKIIGQRLTEAREAAGISARELSKKLSISDKQWYFYCSGSNRISAGRLWKIAKILSVKDLNQFFS